MLLRDGFRGPLNTRLTCLLLSSDGTPKQRSKIIESVLDNKVDILLSSYETISAEFGKNRTDSKGKSLESIHGAGFHRIILDEAHVIRNHKNKVFKAIISVSDHSKYRLALTGTVYVPWAYQPVSHRSRFLISIAHFSILLQLCKQARRYPFSPCFPWSQAFSRS